jgi:hypothetical protein
MGFDYTKSSGVYHSQLFTGTTLNYHAALNNTSYFYNGCSIKEKPDIALFSFKNIRQVRY